MNSNHKYNPQKHHRRSIRLKGYDYSQAGLYFITICCQDRAYLFGEIVNGKMILNNAGQMVEDQWLQLKNRFKNIELHEYVVMPNHFHAIVEIVGATLLVDQTTVAINGNGSSNNEITRDNITIIDDGNIIGQPQGIDKGQPQGIDKGQPQGIAPTEPQMESPKIAPAEPQDMAKKIKTIGDILGAFQSIVTVEYIRGVKTQYWKKFNGKLWQRNYYEHIIRDQQAYVNISEYIINNPAKWDMDKFFKPTK